MSDLSKLTASVVCDQACGFPLGVTFGLGIAASHPWRSPDEAWLLMPKHLELESSPHASPDNPSARNGRSIILRKDCEENIGDLMRLVRLAFIAARM